MKLGYNVDLKYTNNKSEKPKTRKQNIIWFNQPFNIRFNKRCKNIPSIGNKTFSKKPKN